MTRISLGAEERRAIFQRCERALGGNPPRRPAAILAELAEAASEDVTGDRYGSGDLVERFESEVAELLGKEAAAFFPTGTMAQQIALRIWSDRKRSKTVAFHPTCHLETHEQKAYQVLHGLQARLVGDPLHLITLGNLEKIHGPLAALLLELPQREIGSLLPEWDDLQAQIAWTHENGAAVHMDGARLWESAPFYGRTYAEIAAPFDSVYVSFYKTLDALAGAALAGPADFIAEARVWRRRHGGELFQFYPYVISARHRLRTCLDRMQEYHDRALELAAILADIPGVEVRPNPPHTNMMHVFLLGDPEMLMERSLVIAREDRVALFGGLNEAQVPGWSVFELVMRDNDAPLSAEEVRRYFTYVLIGEPQLAGAGSA